MSPTAFHHSTTPHGPFDPAAEVATVPAASWCGPGQTAGSVLTWVLRRAALGEWSALRPAEQLVAQVHPDDPVLREHVLKRARARLHSRATLQLGSREQRALATLTVAINLSRQQGAVDPCAARDGGGPGLAPTTDRAVPGDQPPAVRVRYPVDPSYFLG